MAGLLLSYMKGRQSSDGHFLGLLKDHRLDWHLAKKKKKTGKSLCGSPVAELNAGPSPNGWPQAKLSIGPKLYVWSFDKLGEAPLPSGAELNCGTIG